MQPTIPTPTIGELAEIKLIEMRIEAAIAKYESTSLEIWNLLLDFHQKRLWRWNYSNIADYIQKRWGVRKSRAYQMINWAVMAQQLPKEVSTMVENERVAREVSKIPPADRPKLLTDLKNNGEPVTAKAVAKAVAELKAPEPKAPVDCMGWPINESIQHWWERRQEVQDLLTAVSRVKCALEKAAKEDDALLGWVANFAVPSMDRAYQHLKNALPYAVCTSCQGHPVEQKCSFCHGTGLISETFFYNQSQDVARKMRLKQLGKTPCD